MALAGAAYLAAAAKVPPVYGAVLGAAVEGLFALAVLALHVRWRGDRPAQGG